MKTPTYKEQFDKITGAYIKGLLNPYNPCACFIGNLLNGNPLWDSVREFDDTPEKNWTCVVTCSQTRLKNGSDSIRIQSNGLYNVGDIIFLEDNFLNLLVDNEDGKPTEESLFHAMSSTIDLLREIHISKGENVDAITLTKRVLDI